MNFEFQNIGAPLDQFNGLEINEKTKKMLVAVTDILMLKNAIATVKELESIWYIYFNYLPRYTLSDVYLVFLAVGKSVTKTNHVFDMAERWGVPFTIEQILSDLSKITFE